MALTRRTPAFGQIAAEVDEQLVAKGIVLDQAAVDRVLNEQVEHVGRLMGISPRAALRYAPENLASILSDRIHAYVDAQHRPGLRLVRDDERDTRSS